LGRKNLCQRRCRAEQSALKKNFRTLGAALKMSELIALDSLATLPACFGVYKSTGKLVRLSAGKEPFAAR
jgi:hypothetical protein